MFVIKNKKIKLCAGFSLIELIATMSIILVLSSITIIGYQKSKERTLLRNEVRKALMEIRKAQNNSLSGIDFPLCIYSGKKKLGRMGMYFSVASDAERRQYSVFVDKSDSFYCDDLCAFKCDILTGELIEKIPMSEYAALGTDAGNSGSAFLPTREGAAGINNFAWSLLFVAPDPTIKICRGSYLVDPANCNYNALRLTFYSKSGMAESITVYTSGRIDANF